MKTFSVIVTRDITESCVVTVQAEDEDAAKDLAIDKALASKERPENEWHTDESAGDPYVTGCDEEIPGEEEKNDATHVGDPKRTG